MSSTLKHLDHWHQTKTGLAVFGLVELVAAYGVGSRAISTGSYWEYLLAVILLVGAVQNLVRLFKRK